jgi:hypothetical protein
VNRPQIAQTAPVNRESAPKSVHQKKKKKKREKEARRILAGFRPDLVGIRRGIVGITVD